MLKFLLILILLVAVPSLAGAQSGGFIIPYWDAAGTECLLASPMPFGICVTYFYHVGTPSAKGSQFKVQLENWNETFVSFDTGYLYIAPGFPPNPLGGIRIDYVNPSCEPLPKLILTITWLCAGLSPDCAAIRVVPDPAAPLPNVIAFDCNGDPVAAGGSAAFYGQPGCVEDFCWVPNSQRTWSSIKALYD